MLREPLLSTPAVTATDLASMTPRRDSRLESDINEDCAGSTATCFDAECSAENDEGLLYFLRRAAAIDTGCIAIVAPQGDEPESPSITTWRYSQLLDDSMRNAALLRRSITLHQLPLPGKVVLIHLDNHADNLTWFWAVVAAGFLPAVSTPLSPDPEQRVQHVQHLRRLLQNPVCLTSERLLRANPELAGFEICTTEQLSKSVEASAPVSNVQHMQTTNSISSPETQDERPQQEKPAVLMLTSGSSGNAKAVSITFRQCLHSIRAKVTGMETDRHSTFLNWIGMDHVANLVEVHLHSMWLGIPQVHVHASDLLSDPLMFIRLLDRFEVTHTFAPNFFLQMLDRQLAECEDVHPVRGCDLSRLKTIMSGGEANVVSIVNSISKRLSALGAPDTVLRLGYGSTETCAACIYAVFDPEYELAERHEFGSIGQPTPAVQVRIMRPNRTPASPYEVGDLEITGPAVFSEYYNDTENTAKALTADGWFKTGDRAFIDKHHKLNLSGRAKELLNINGVKHAPQDVELAIERAAISGVLASNLAVFAYRPQDSATESYCVVCGVDIDIENDDEMQHLADQVARHASAVVGLRPFYVIPRSRQELQKSSLGKLSRSKLHAQLTGGMFDETKIATSHPLRHASAGPRQPPSTAMEHLVVDSICEMLHLPADSISMDQSLFELGISSISLFRFEAILSRRLHSSSSLSTSSPLRPQRINLISLLNNPILSAISSAISTLDSPTTTTYQPVANLQPHGDKTPLWLIHPASGNAISFLPLARTLLSRPLYALTTRGLHDNEPLFESLDEMADVYFKHIKQTQPTGPYALTGYSLGTTIAYEIALRLERNGDEVAFCGALDSPPHIIPLVERLDWFSAAAYIAFFFDLIPQDLCESLAQKFREEHQAQQSLSHNSSTGSKSTSEPLTNTRTPDNTISDTTQLATITHLLSISHPHQLSRLSLTADQLLSIVNVSHNYGRMLQTYHPHGNIRRVDVFFCQPLQHITHDRDQWRREHLQRWSEFSREEPEFVECEGEHADMLSAKYVVGFARRLEEVLQRRGV